jgi:hypothetical protein
MPPLHPWCRVSNATITPPPYAEPVTVLGDEDHLLTSASTYLQLLTFRGPVAAARQGA